MMPVQRVEPGGNQEPLQRPRPRPPHAGFKDGGEDRKHARLFGDLPCDLKVGLAGGPSAPGADGCPLHRPPRSIRVASDSSRKDASGSRSDRTVMPSSPAARVSSASRVPAVRR